MTQETSAWVPDLSAVQVVSRPSEVSDAQRLAAAGEVEDALAGTSRARRLAFWIVAAIAFVLFLPAALPFGGWAWVRSRHRKAKMRALEKRLRELGFGAGLAHRVVQEVAAQTSQDANPEEIVRRALATAERVLEHTPDIVFDGVLRDHPALDRLDRVLRFSSSPVSLLLILSAALVGYVGVAAALGGWALVAAGVGILPMIFGVAIGLERLPGTLIPKPLRPLLPALRELQKTFGSLENAVALAPPAPAGDLAAARARQGLAAAPDAEAEPVGIEVAEKVERG